MTDLLTELRNALLKRTDALTGSSPWATAIPGLTVLRSKETTQPHYLIFKPALCLVVQGAKWALFGNERGVERGGGERIDYRAGEALLVSVEMPAIGCVAAASPAEPYLGVVLEFDPAAMREVLEMLASPVEAKGDISRGVLLTSVEGPLMDCVLRAIRLLDRPEAIPILYPALMREVCYWVLTGPHGGEVVKMTMGTSHAHQMVSAIHLLRDRFAEPVRMDELASVAKMSSSAFHRQFKAMTSMTPLQYQKQLRLIEARRLMVSEGANVESAAYKVGYESASQFSREYSRMFGGAPKRESARVRHAVA